MRPIRITSARITHVVAGLALALLMASPLAMAQDSQAQELYPNATREEPELDLRSQDVADNLNKAAQQLQAGKLAEAVPLLQKILADSDSSYAKAMALQNLANVAYQKGDLDKAINLLKQSLANGVMPNDTYFQLMYNLVQYYVADDQYDEALQLLQQWREQGKRETAQSYAVEGNIYYLQGEWAQAITALEKAKQLNQAEGKTSMPSAWAQMLAASYAKSGDTDKALKLAQQAMASNPDDIISLRNTVSLLIQTEQYDQAVTLLQQAFDEGLVKKSSDYINLAKLYMMVAQSSDEPATKTREARAVLDKGLANGTLEKSYEVYKLAGDAAQIGMNYDKAMASYKLAAPYAETGDIYVRMGRIFANQGKYSEAIDMAKKGLDKGLDKPGRAYMLMGAAYGNSGQDSAAIAAVKKAAQYPDTRERAESWLSEVGG